MKNRIGFFGGCFNPVTKAHIELAKQAMKLENLGKIYFVPMGDLYPKKDLISLEHRINMLTLAFSEEMRFEILDISNKKEKMYAIDTFQTIDKMFPQADRFFIMGSDNYQKILEWKSAQDLIKNYHYIVLDRETGNTKHISSSLVRQKVKRNETIEDLVPNQVAEYIKQKNLYK